MKGDPGSMTVLRPRGAAQALRMYARRPDAIPLAGGTDFMVAWNAGERDGRAVLDLSAVREWRGIRRTAGVLSIGALATHAELGDDHLVRRHFPVLARAAAAVGSAQIQNRGTLGGNVANASPAADTLPALAVYDARIATAGGGGRRLQLSDFLIGVKKNALLPGELITAVELPLLPRRPDRQLFRKVGPRAAMAISKTVAAGLLWLDRGGAVRELRFALGAMAPTVARLKAAEEFVRGRKLTPALAEEACRLLDQDVAPIDDPRSTAAYRLAVSRNLLREFLAPRF
ncbi:MAG: xanthine dehydrogenase family protein subunit M [Elusimicrobia bacterium]|nr:xanthine dehydrogenase family protein subunit M [Elusimicrobiota bacterium]